MSEELARVLAHPLRDRVLFEYQGAPAAPSEVARRLGRPLNLVSYHTAVLVRLGCLELVRTERRRGALTRVYRSTVGQILDPGAWRSLPRARRRALVLGTLGQVAGEARRAALAGGFDDPYAFITRVQLELDEEGARAANAALQRALDEIMALAAHDGARAGPRGAYELAIIASIEPSGSS